MGSTAHKFYLCHAARCMVPHRVDQVNARLERAHHPNCRRVEQLGGDMIQQITLELEVDAEVDEGPIRDRREGPYVRQMFQRPVDSAH